MKKILIFILFLSLFTLFGCSKNQGFTKTIYVFDTTVTINLYEGNESNLDDIVDILNYYNKLTDAYHTYDGTTNVKSINDNIKSGSTEIELEVDDKFALLATDDFWERGHEADALAAELIGVVEHSDRNIDKVYGIYNFEDDVLVET